MIELLNVVVIYWAFCMQYGKFVILNSSLNMMYIVLLITYY